MKKTVVINIVGLTKRLIGEHTPFIQSFLAKGAHATINPVLPAVTCAAQATYLTGKWPSEHGIVGNGWYFKEECEVKFWRQSNPLVQSEKIWDSMKKADKSFSCANLFWWYNMYSTVDYSVTPRPNYLANGRKIPDVYSHPPELRDSLQESLGTFPLFHFWGPKTSIKSSKWIADAAIKTDMLYNPTLTLVYLPHLDYNLQRHGLNFKLIYKDLLEIDALVADLVGHYDKQDVNIIMLSEYGITNVQQAVHINRVLRAEGYLQVRIERGLELLDAGASIAFAVADHQIAHIYIKDPSQKTKVRQRLEKVPGVKKVLHDDALKKAHLGHERCGDLVLIAEADAWFTYYYWMDDKKAPDFARMVDIHKKPGYDPVEMFTDPNDFFLIPKIIGKLLLKKLGFRTLMDIIPLKPELVKGSHGAIPDDKKDYPLFITNNTQLKLGEEIEPIAVYDLIQNHVQDKVRA